MRFVALGTGTAWPDPTRAPASYLVEHEGSSWLVDFGSGCLRRVAAAGVDPLGLMGGVLSHRHLDHAGDLASILFTYRVTRRTAPWRLVGGEGVAAHLGALRAAHDRGVVFDGGVDVTELSLGGPDTTSLGPIRLDTRPAPHSLGALHLSFAAGGRRVVFSGDTGPSDALVELARGADLLVCECAGSDEAPVPRHLTPSAVRDLVDAARPSAVWLTHLYPDVDPRRAVATVAEVGVPVQHAWDGLVFA
jgi:ribonuclease BN (tRNA processing enzyme)